MIPVEIFSPFKEFTLPNVAIVTDSVACIPEEMSQALDIHQVPYYIHRGTETLRDLVTIKCDAFYEWLPTAKVLPKTACPGPGDYAQVYESLARDKGVREIVSLHITSKGSAAYQSAEAAKVMLAESVPDLHLEIVDTLNASMCQGWMAIQAARAALAGKSLAEIVRIVQTMIPVTRMLQTGDTLRYLYLGGRIGRAKHLVGSLLNIKPLIGIEDGVIVPLGIARSRQKAYETMVDMVEAAVGPHGKIRIAYVHAAALEEAQKIRELIEQRLDCVESLFAELTPALGVHSGPGTAGLCYFPILD
ncbi:MAG TPA: DegV family protein [Anaerolineae bacterium]